MKILLDGMIRTHAHSHLLTLQRAETKWGPLFLRIDVATVTRRPRKSTEHAWLQEQIDCVPRIAKMAKSGEIELFTSIEIEFETMGRAFPRGTSPDTDAFYDVTIQKIPPFAERTILWSALGCKEQELRRKMEFLKGIHDERFAALDEATGGNKSADVFHLLTAERSGIDCLLTMDRKFINSVRTQTKVALRVAVLTPIELVNGSGHT